MCPVSNDDDWGLGGSSADCSFSCDPYDVISISVSADDDGAQVDGIGSCGDQSVMCDGIGDCSDNSDWWNTETDLQGTCHGETDENWDSGLTLTCSTRPETNVCDRDPFDPECDDDPDRYCPLFGSVGPFEHETCIDYDPMYAHLIRAARDACMGTVGQPREDLGCESRIECDSGACADPCVRWTPVCNPPTDPCTLREVPIICAPVTPPCEAGHDEESCGLPGEPPSPCEGGIVRKLCERPVPPIEVPCIDYARSLQCEPPSDPCTSTVSRPHQFDVGCTDSCTQLSLLCVAQRHAQMHGIQDGVVIRMDSGEAAGILCKEGHCEPMATTCWTTPADRWACGVGMSEAALHDSRTSLFTGPQ